MKKMEPHTELTEFRERLKDDEVLSASQLIPFGGKKKGVDPRTLLAITFVLLITFGGILLASPLSQATGAWAWEIPDAPFSWARFGNTLLDNFFMATSASCVTGLSLFDISSYYSFTGQLILLICIQLGGLSLLTLGTMIVAILLGRVTVGGEAQVMLSYGTASSKNAHSLLGKTIRYVISFELIGAFFLFVRYHWYHGYAIAEGAWYAIFHSVSAFCNAGFSLHPENLIAMRGDVAYTLVISILVTLGGIGFLVIANLFQYHFWKRDLRKRGRISLHARLVLWTSLILTVGGGILFAILEWNSSLGANAGNSPLTYLLQADWHGCAASLYSSFEKLVTAIAHSAMCRTAGFNFVPPDEVTPPGNLLSVFFMLIGGSPGSMAGGFKTTTLVTLLLTIRAYICANPDVQIHHRTISDSICREAMVIVFFYISIVFFFYFILLLTEQPFIAQRGDFGLFYEVTSAFGTVGLSLNATTLLSPFGRFIIILAMFLGRIGPISLALILAGRDVSHRIRYPEESITVG